MLGFILRSRKRFLNPESIVTLYKAYTLGVNWSIVRSFGRLHIKIPWTSWKKYRGNSPTRTLYRKFNWPKVEHNQQLKVPLIESRRIIADEIFLYKVVNRRFTVTLDDDVVLFSGVRSTRQVPPIFYPPANNTNIEANSPNVRMQLNHDNLYRSYRHLP